jgi:hypothetical protein
MMISSSYSIKLLKHIILFYDNPLNEASIGCLGYFTVLWLYVVRLCFLSASIKNWIYYFLQFQVLIKGLTDLFDTFYIELTCLIIDLLFD